MPKTALVITDMLNPYDHEDADPLAESVREKLPCIVELLADARAASDDEVMVIYANDNQDQWEAGREELIEAAMNGKHPELVDPIAPRDPVPFMAKGRHSVFYQTAFGHLLTQYEVERIVLAGQVTEQCILYSALDAYMRGYEIVVPTDAVAHIHEDLAEGALAMMERNMHAELMKAAEVFG